MKKTKGKEIGKSLLEADKVELAKELLAQGGEKIILLDLHPAAFSLDTSFRR